MSTDNSEFLNKYGPWALVTGTSSGIGKDIAIKLAAKGLNVVISARRKDRLVELAKQLETEYKIETKILVMDLNDQDFLGRMLAETSGLDIGLIVCNAGYGVKGEHWQQTIEDLDRTLAVNSRVPMLMTQAFTPALIERGKGGFILVGSIEGLTCFPLSGVYSASKNFLHTLGDALWKELKPYNVDVLNLAPGATDTEGVHTVATKYLDVEALGELMSSDEVAEDALKYLGKKRLHVPGRKNQFLAKMLMILPRSLVLSMTESGMKQVLKKNKH